jgi:hypothetical protein
MSHIAAPERRVIRNDQFTDSLEGGEDVEDVLGIAASTDNCSPGHPRPATSARCCGTSRASKFSVAALGGVASRPNTRSGTGHRRVDHRHAHSKAFALGKIVEMLDTPPPSVTGQVAVPRVSTVRNGNGAAAAVLRDRAFDVEGESAGRRAGLEAAIWNTTRCTAAVDPL